MIQILTCKGNERGLTGEGIELHSLHDTESLDSYEINVFDLSDAFFWRRDRQDIGAINQIKDFKSVAIMLKNSKSAKNVILLPQNIGFLYYLYGSTYEHECELKDMIHEMQEYSLGQMYWPLKSSEIVYEKTKTKVGSCVLPAAFYFVENDQEKILTKSQGSDKPTTVVGEERIFLSTLKMKSSYEVISLLKEIGLIENHRDIPEWMDEMKMFDDDAQDEIIRTNKIRIAEAEEKITFANEILDMNREYKSILYTSGDELVKVVLRILGELLEYDFTNFTDIKKEDFLAEIEGEVFIGEIKGVNHNIKSENVSQLEVHYQQYLDEHIDADEKNIHALLIMNHQKNKPVKDREPVHDTQIGLAKRNGSLIIETYELLKMLEKYRNNELTKAECIKILSDSTGLLTL